MEQYIFSNKLIIKTIRVTVILAASSFFTSSVVLANLEEDAIGSDKLQTEFNKTKLEETLEKTKEQLNTSLEETLEKTKEWIEIKTGAKEKIEQLQNLVQQKNEKLQQLTQETNFTQMQLDQVQQQLQQTQNKTKELQQELQHKEDKIRLIEAQYTQDIQNVEKQYQDKLINKKNKLQAIKDEKNNLEEKTEIIVQELAHNNRKIEELQSILNTKQQKLEEQQINSQKMLVDADDMKTKYDTIITYTESLQTKVANLNDSLQQIILTKEEEINRLNESWEQEKDKVQQELLIAQNQILTSENDTKQLQDYIIQIKNIQQEELNKISENYQQQINSINMELSDAKKRLNDVEYDNYNQLEQNRDWELIQYQFEQQNASQILSLQQEKENLYKEKTALENHINTLTTEIAKTQSAIEQDTISQLVEKNNLITEKEQLLVDQENKILQLETTLTDAQNQYQKMRYKLKEKLMTVKNTLEENLKTANNEITKLKEENLLKVSDILNLEQKLCANKEKLSELSSKNIKSLQEIEQLNEYINSLKQDLNLLSAQRDNNLSKIEVLEAELASSQIEHDKYLLEIAQLTEQNQVVQNQLAQNLFHIEEEKKATTVELVEDPKNIESSVITDVQSILNSEEPTIFSQVSNFTEFADLAINNATEYATEQLYENINSRVNSDLHFSSGEERSEVEIWIKYSFGKMNQKPTDNITSAYKGYMQGLFCGIDRELEDNKLIGLAIALNNQTTINLQSSKTQLITDNNIFSIYGKNYLSKKLLLSGAISYFYAKTEVKNFIENFDYMRLHGIRIDLELAYLKEITNTIFQPFIGITYNSSANSPFDMALEDYQVSAGTRSSKILTGKLGAKWKLNQYKMNDSLTILPMFSVSVSKPLKIASSNQAMIITNKLGEEKNNLLIYKFNRDYTLNLGADLVIGYDNIDIVASYYLNLKKKYQAHQGSVKLEIKL
ncbi:MAG: autotransporter domain-containing protein [Rickettsiaceae bacterium]|nr:autotransporter domain-containing protein [Rickettsiaceae bacterium]